MPRTSTIPPALKKLLDLLKTNVLNLHRKTKIPRARLVEIYEKGDPTGPELFALFAALGPPLVDYLASALGQRCAERMVNGLQLQIGLANQGGRKNTQYNNYNRHNHLHIHLHVENGPTPKALDIPQRREVQQVQPGGVVRQLGPGGAARELGRAA